MKCSSIELQKIMKLILALLIKQGFPFILCPFFDSLLSDTLIYIHSSQLLREVAW